MAGGRGTRRDEAKKVRWADHENDQTQEQLRVMDRVAGVKE